jgi:hypothetical protein
VIDDDVRAAAGPVAGTPARGPAAAARPAAPEPAAVVAKPLARVGVEPPALPSFEQWGPIERQPLSHLRRTIAERMTLSATLVPHVTHFDRADITELDSLIQRHLAAARARGVTLTLTSFLLKAVALALGEHPTFNASLDAGAGELIVKRYVHLGVAVATERGLIVPVIRDVNKKPLLELQRELGALAQRVREGKATLDDLRGGTFTVTNIGALGGTGAIPIINYPEVAILGDLRPPRGRRRRRRPLRRRHRAASRAARLAAPGAVRPPPYLLSAVAADRIGELLERARRSLRPGGRLVLHDFMLDDDRSGPPVAALWLLNAVTIDPDVASLTPAWLSERVARAGFTGVELRHVIAGITRLLMAEAPRW